MSIPQIKLAHEPDAAWIIALWLAIHGGDPPPDRITVTDEEAVRVARIAATSLVSYMSAIATGDAEALSAESRATLGGAVKRVGVELLAAADPPKVMQPPPYCFRFQGQTICVPRPKKVQSIQNP